MSKPKSKVAVPKALDEATTEEMEFQEKQEAFAQESRARESILPLLALLKKTPDELVEDLKELYRDRVDNPNQLDTSEFASELHLSESELESELTSGVRGKLVDKIRPIAPTLLKEMTTFLDIYRQTGNASKAAAAAGRSTITVGLWCRYYPQFRFCRDLIKEATIDDLEEEARRRAFQGVLKPTGWYKGQPGGYLREYSDNLIMFLIKAHRPQFKDSVGSQTNVAVAVPVTVTNYGDKRETPMDTNATEVAVNPDVIEGEATEVP